MWTLLQREGGQRGRIYWTAVACAALGTVTACGDLLDVELPTRVSAETLDDPALAPVLVQGAVADFECAFANYVPATGLLTEELIGATGWIAITLWDQRRIFPNNGNLGTGDCTDLGYGIFTPLQTARFQAEDAFARIEAFADADVPNKTALLAEAAVYAAYSYTLLGEAFCEVTIDEGPIMQPADALAIAEQRFTTALELATASESEAIVYLARAGRARVRLDLGRAAEAAEDAILIPEDFVAYATRSSVNERRWNRVAVDFHRNYYVSVDPSFRGLTVAGMPDSRVPVVDAGRLGHDGITQIFAQLKYASEGDPMPLASWDEAQLILAEAELEAGRPQGAVDAINRLRAAADLPQYSSADPAAIRQQVTEERRRDLFLEGHRLNDMLRLGIPFAQGTTHKDVVYGPTTCLPLPDAERLNNPSL